MFRGLFLFLGRFCLSLIFLSSGSEKLLDWHGAEQSLTRHLGDFARHVSQKPLLEEALAFSLEHPQALLVVATVFELFGALCVLLGLGVRLGAILLALFLIPATLVYHWFWDLLPPSRDLQMILFLKNLSILGGLFLLIGMGSSKKGRAPKKGE